MIFSPFQFLHMLMSTLNINHFQFLVFKKDGFGDFWIFLINFELALTFVLREMQG
jgi:hypothetical protein